MQEITRDLHGERGFQLSMGPEQMDGHGCPASDGIVPSPLPETSIAIGSISPAE